MFDVKHDGRHKARLALYSGFTLFAILVPGALLILTALVLFAFFIN